MYTLDELSNEAAGHAEAYAVLCDKMSEDLKFEFENITIDAQTDLFRDDLQQGKFFRIQEGIIALSVLGKKLIVFEEGDFIGEWLVDANRGIELTTDFAVKVNQYDQSQVTTEFCSNPELINLWQQILSQNLKFLIYCFGYSIKSDDQPSPEIKKYEPNEVIIEEGTQGDEVFTMLTGEASVLVNGIEVGKISEDQIFGALSPITGRKRTATIRAVKQCLVLSLPGDNFLELMASRPHTVLRLIEDMADRIVSLNEKLVSLAD